MRQLSIIILSIGLTLTSSAFAAAVHKKAAQKAKLNPISPVPVDYTLYHFTHQTVTKQAKSSFPLHLSNDVTISPTRPKVPNVHKHLTHHEFGAGVKAQLTF